MIGGGYIGYPLALLVASAGTEVLVVDIDPSVVADIERGAIRTEEPELVELASQPEVRGRMSAASSPARSSVFVIAVPTPLREGTHEADLTMVENAAAAVAPHLESGNLVIVESTVPPGTTNEIIGPILETSGLQVGRTVLLAHCPERLHPGSTLTELRENDRIIGGVNGESCDAASRFYGRFTSGALVRSNAVTAELCKLFENTYRDVNLALANQLAGLAESFGVSGTEVLELASRHPRVDFLSPGIGVGGHCIPIDPWFLHQVAPELTELVVAARRANDEREKTVADRIAARVRAGGGDTAVIAGAAYKANVTDRRGSPSLAIAHRLSESGLETRIHDPLIPEYSNPLLEAAHGADLIAVTVPHTVVIQALAQQRTQLIEVMRRPDIIDISSGWPVEI